MNAVACMVLCALLPQGGAGDGAGQKQPQTPGKQRRVKPMPIPGTVILHLGKNRIVVDGSLSEWPEKVADTAVQLVDTRQVSGTAMGAYNPGLQHADISGRVFLCWDEKRLYVGARVADDWHRRLARRRTLRFQEIPPTDSLMLSFDPNRDSRSLGPDGGRREDREFWLADVEGQRRHLVYWDRFRGTSRYAEGAELVVKRDQEKRVTVYEAAIPWDEILPRKQKPNVGLTMNFQAVLNDFDEPTDPMPQTRVGWTFGVGPVIDPGIFGTVMLVREFDPNRPPRMPKAPRIDGDPVPPPAYWVRFHERLRKAPPAFVDASTVDPAAAGGMERYKLLQELEGHLAKFPRVDFLEFQSRIHRRMVRETAGIAQTGLPFFWHYRLKDVGRRVPLVPAAGHIRVFRLPQGGWFVRSAGVNFAIDPAGYQLAHYIGRAIDFVLLTRPLDLTKRNDQLLIRVAASKKLIHAHLPYHLPGVDAATMELVRPGHYTSFGEIEANTDKGPAKVPLVTIQAIGRQTKQGFRPASMGYLVRWHDGTTLLHPGVSLEASDLRTVKGVDVLLLSALHPRAAAVGRQVAARHTILDEVLEVGTAQGADARVTLDQALKLQETLRPLRSVLLAPGESVDVKRSRRQQK